MSDNEDQIANILSRYRMAVLDKDVEGMMELYADDIRVFDTWGVWTHDGIAAWRQVVEHWFGSLKDEIVKVVFDDVRTERGSDLAVVSAVTTYTAVSANGEELRSMQNRVTRSLVRRADLWKIVHEHSSAPIRFEDMKAILMR
ncbi:YybH family protein [Bradyrhizobium sp. McL0616]|uniref:YybH family protein n=1 Tax=Bradyrhizobium sp. McL0616 TaxID=3415674 RepID=UPI003CFB1B66